VNPSPVEIVLVRPRRAANVAATCRAMKNMGLRALTLVGPAADLDAPEARALAYGAWDVLDGATRAASLREAVAASTWVLATSSRPDPAAWTPRRRAAEAAGRAAGGPLSVVFGPENSGLSAREIALCHGRVRVPTDPAHPSLNLAQAVLIVAYELRLAAQAPESGGASIVGEPARSGEVEDALDHLRRALLAIGFLNPANPEAILGELRALLARAVATRREVRLLRGLARQIEWAADRRIAPPAGNDR
jgi:TrmH family RNA methyltransferase